MSNLPLAFLLGFLGSMHCAVMCGPLMLSLPLAQKKSLGSYFQLLLYQLGRILSYTLMGLLVGLVGNSLILFSNQETLSLIMGAGLIVFAILYFSGNYLKSLGSFQARLISPISKLMGKIYGLPYWGFLSGVLNGLIPCGMVYLALATAINSGSVLNSMGFMCLFGMGTSPLMLFISVGGIHLKKYIRINTNKLVPWFTLFLGVLFLFRAAELGIPFLSPAHHLHQGTSIECR